MSSIRRQRPSSAYVAYPAELIDHTVLEDLGLLWGTRPDENPPKVVMTRAEWDRLLANRRAVRRALRFTGDSWSTNPTIPPPADLPEAARTLTPDGDQPRPWKGRKRPRGPGQFDHLKTLPPVAAMDLANAEHTARVAGGMDETTSTKRLLKALSVIRHAMVNRVEPRPLPAIEGDDPPTPTELRQMDGGR